MITAVNTLHSSGLTMAAPPDDTGVDFFTGTDASDIAVNTAVVSDSNLLAAALNTEGVPGGNGNAIAISERQYSLSMSGGTATFDDFYDSLVSDVGRNVSQAKVNTDHQSMISLQLSTYREEVSGVSMDEEMVNMVQFQSAYTAAAKLVNTVDEMLQTLIEMV
jgi:flagellar hook-associated protein 1 FlgK